MAAGTLPHVGGGAPFPCPIDASHDGRRPERSGLATAAAWPDSKFAGCLCWREAYHQVFDALGVSSVLWQSQRSDALTFGIWSSFQRRRLNLCQRPEGSPPSPCGLPTLWQLHIAFDLLEAKCLASLVGRRATKVWECDTATITPSRIVVKMQRSASDGAPLAELLAQGR